MAGPIKKVLIANRGEIAVRVIRACRELGLATVAVYSDVDCFALHTRLADAAYGIGRPPSTESYLVQEKILDVAKRSGADAIHPGYGFLAENPEFADQVNAAGLIFIGPTADAMRLMGDKTMARARMRAAGVPVVPGTETALADESTALQESRAIGFPVLLKAAAGGGGKGMRVVATEAEVARAFRAAQSEAESAFGDGRVYVEKYLTAPRHIEIQVLADNFGNVVHLGERECSIQRRHQKIIEEAPSCILDQKLRNRMGEAGVQAAKACGYRNAGTIEFMVDGELNFYFLEMNTRLQVEHPVTELVTGLDLVKEQIRLANGEALDYEQTDISMEGHAIECRVYAEDPENGFLPSTGKIQFMTVPQGPGVRVDGGYESGSEISPYYDPLIAKLITHGKDRAEAIARMRRALGEYEIFGVDTSLSFCKMVMEHENFLGGEFDTGFVEEYFFGARTSKNPDQGRNQETQEMAVLAAVLFEKQFHSKEIVGPKGVAARDGGAWKHAGRRSQMRNL